MLLTKPLDVRRTSREGRLAEILRRSATCCRVVRIAVVLAAILVLGARRPVVAAGPRVVQTEGVRRIRLLPPGEGNPRNSEGDFVRLKDGRILFVYTHFTGGGSDHSAAHLAGRFSRDGGKTWTERDVVILENEAKMNVMSVSLLRLDDGRIALFYLRKNSLDDCRPYVRFSDNETQSWSKPRLCIEPVGYYVVNNDRVVQLRSGRLIIPTSRHNLTGGTWTGRGVSLCYYSDDRGRTWTKSQSELEAPRQSRSGLQEPGIVELKDGRLMMFCRTDQGSQYLSYSKDAGRTWSNAVPSNIISPVSPASIERIPSTGDLLLVYNNHDHIDPARRGKRTPLTVAISKDDGRTWQHAKNLEDDPHGWYCYTAILFAGDHVLLGHCAGDRRTGGLSLTQITLVNLDWLYR